MGGAASVLLLDSKQRQARARKAAQKRWGKLEFVRVAKQLTPSFIEKGAFLVWARAAKHGEQAVYFMGELATFRQTAPQRIVELERLADDSTPALPRPPGEAIEIDLLRSQLELSSSVSAMATAGVFHLTQKRADDGSGKWAYLATKSGVR